MYLAWKLTFSITILITDYLYFVQSANQIPEKGLGCCGSVVRVGRLTAQRLVNWQLEGWQSTSLPHGGTVPCSKTSGHCVASSLLLTTVCKHLGIKRPDLWERNVVPFHSSSLSNIEFHDAPNIFSCWKVGSAPWLILLLPSHDVVIDAVCGWIMRSPPCYPNRSTCCSKTCIYLFSIDVASPQTLMRPHTVRDAGFWSERW